MKVVQPITISAANIISSNLYETAPTAYAGGTTYGLNAYASVAGLLGEILIYRSLQAGNIGHTPSSSPTWWVYSSSTYVPYTQVLLLGQLRYYDLGYRVTDPLTGDIYESLTPSNTEALDPIGSPPWYSIGINTTTLPSSYNAGTTYAVDALVRYFDVIVDFSSGTPVTSYYEFVFKSLQAGNIGHTPDLLSDTAYWQRQITFPVPWSRVTTYGASRVVYTTDNKLWQTTVGSIGVTPFLVYVPTWLKISPSNLVAPFDSQTSTRATAFKEITYVINTGIIDTIGLIGTDADSAIITVRNGLGGTIVYQRTLGLTGGNPTNAWDYYFSDPTIRLTQAVADEIPPYANSHVTITLTGLGTIGVGNIIFGKSQDVGLTEYGVQAGIIDFSTKTTDSFGNTTFVKRGFKKSVSCRAFVENTDLNKIQNTLYALRASPCLWILTNDPKLSEACIVYGFYKDFSTEISYPTVSYINYQIEGLI